MTFKNKWVPFFVLGIVSVIVSRGIFALINDPEGPNLLIVLALAVALYVCSYMVYKLISLKNTHLLNMRNSIIRVGLVVGLILLVPLFGNLYVEGWNWSLSDFFIMGTLLFGFGIAINYAANKIRDTKKKVLAILGITFLLLIIWTQMAVQAVSQIIKFIF